jgi:hypothetical protein
MPARWVPALATCQNRIFCGLLDNENPNATWTREQSVRITYVADKFVPP